MKKLLSILLLSISLIGCSKLSKSFYNGINKLASVVTLEERVLYDELTNKGTGEKPIMYFEGALFNGVGFGVNPDGQLIFESRFKNGVLDGLEKLWYENGQLQLASNYKDGEYDGLVKSWYDNGQLWHEANYKDGERIGLYKLWHSNGQLEWEENYKDGKKDGLLKTWDENGQLELEVNYKDGVLIE